MNSIKTQKLFSIIIGSVLFVSIALAIILPFILKHEHSYTTSVVSASCTERGYTLHTCNCGKSYKDSYINALEHDMGDWNTTTPATCTTDGAKEKTCSHTGCSHKETAIIAKTHIDGNNNHACDICDLNAGEGIRTALPTEIGWESVGINNIEFITLMDEFQDNSDYVNITHCEVYDNTLKIRLTGITQTNFDEVVESFFNNVGAKYIASETEITEMGFDDVLTTNGNYEYSSGFQTSSTSLNNVYMRYFLDSGNLDSSFDMVTLVSLNTLEIQISVGASIKETIGDLDDVSQKINDVFSFDEFDILLPQGSILNTTESYYLEGADISLNIEYALDTDIFTDLGTEHFNSLCQSVFEKGANRDPSDGEVKASKDSLTNEHYFYACYGERITSINIGGQYRCIEIELYTDIETNISSIIICFSIS